MSNETTDTLGSQKATNYALRADMTKEEFIKELLTGLTAPPGYFPQNVLMNIKGYEAIDVILERGTNALSIEEFEAVANETGALVLDTRSDEEFSKGYIPNSINIGLDGSFAQWVGEMIPDVKQEILLVTDPGKEEEAVTRLARVGYDYSLGYLKGGFEAWKIAGKDYESISRTSAEELASIYSENPVIVDVRKASEFESEHIENAVNIPLNQINSHLAEFPKDRSFFIHCAGGYRSMIASSILKQRGWTNFVDIRGGFKAIKETSIPVTQYVEPATLL
jgi:rhodanese-related sulfurtransferase